jgi:hypothetical protein
MGDAKKGLGGILKHHFWILSALVLIAASVGFILTAMGLSKLITDRIGVINSKYGEVQTVSGKLSTHPNEQSHKRMDAMIKDMETDVRRAWQMQYQLQSDLMIWPDDAFDSKEVADIFRTLRPVEKFVDFPIAELKGDLARITEGDRRVYRDYIGPVFNSVSKIIGTEWRAKLAAIRGGGAGFGGYGSGAGGYGSGDAGYSGSGAGYGSEGSGSGYGGYGGMGPGDMGMGGMGTPMQPLTNDVVLWSEQSQQTLMNQILPWYNPNGAPSILDIYYTQEDIWLLTNIMEIIKATNGNARENFQATVKEIQWIRMGKHAKRDSGALFGGGGMGGMGMDMGGMGMDMGYGGEGGSDMSSGSSMYGSEGGSDTGEIGGEMGGMMGMGGMAAIAVDPADNRYISFATETFFQPRKGEEVRTSIRDPKTNPVDAVAKRIPIRFRVRMDASKVNRLITECGNAKFMLEVYQVRLNAAEDSTGGGYGAGMGGMGGMGGDGGASLGARGLPGGGGAGGSGGMGAGSLGSEGMGGEMGYGSAGGGYGADPTGMMGGKFAPLTEIPVEIFGLVYLYNPDSVDLLTDPPPVEETNGESTNPDPNATADGGTSGNSADGQVASGSENSPAANTANAADPNATNPPASNPAEPSTPPAAPNASADPTAPSDPTANPNGDPNAATPPPPADSTTPTPPAEPSNPPSSPPNGAGPGTGGQP